MRTIGLVIAKIMTSAALAAAFASTGAMAATPAKAPANAAANKAEVQDAMLYLKVLISGLQSDKVEQPVKGALVGCLYNNSLGQITSSMDKVIAENPGKIHKDNPNELLGVLVRICGYNPQAAGSNNTASGR